MINANRKEFLNTGILGGGAGIAEKRSFRAVRTEYLTVPDYDPQYFETFPTAWAAGYAFRKVLDLPVKPGAETGLFAEEVATAVEEWVTLFLLHYFGVTYLAEFKQNELQQNYDRDLWQALSGTYPSAREDAPKSIKLLQHNETVVGAYYPGVVFFPARDRTSWQKDKPLADYLLDNHLSWPRSRRVLLTTEKESRAFHSHLRLIAEHAIPKRSLQDRLYRFCESNFDERIDLSGTLDPDPAKWEVPGLKVWEPGELLDLYPLRKPKKPSEQEDDQSGGRIFYLLDGLPELQPWMKAAIVPSGPAPYQYRKLNDQEIVVELPGRRFVCRKQDNDEVVLLKDLFLSDTPHWCKIPKTSEMQAAHIRSLHKMELRDPVITEKDTAVCLAPIKSEFIRHFPEVLTNLEKISALPSLEGASVEWSIPVMRTMEVKWQTRPSYAKGLSASSLAMWPPKASSEWRFYAAYGIGTKEDSGRWNLIDQNGNAGRLVDIEDEEYVSVLEGADGPNQPRALMLSDNGDRERGIAFLMDFGGDQTTSQTAELAVDFGTSNTCLAYCFRESQPETLRFTLTPRPLWGKRGDLDTALELAGFFPYKWSAITNKGFYPTTLLSRRSDSRLEARSPETVTVADLFKVDIPGLHKRLEGPLFEGRLNATWKHHTDLKWRLQGDGNKGPWRELFLELTLLYAHAELFFTKHALVNSYVFTFPLAFSKPDRESYHSKAKLALNKVRSYCYGPRASRFEYIDKVDESTAIAESIGSVGTKSTIQVFIDVGGGTADVAIAHDGRYLVLDSILVAGNAFFRFARNNSASHILGASEFRRHLTTLLMGDSGGYEFPLLNSDTNGLELDVAYSVFISGVEDDEFRDREAAILKKTMGKYSYQGYRTRLFFRHLMAYGLLQACAAVVDQQISLPPKGGLELILGGNGWGLLLFGELPRSAERLKEEAESILALLKQKLIEDVSEEERVLLDSLRIADKVHLLNEEDLSKAKTNVAKGALNAARNDKSGDRNLASPYSGITLSEFRLRPDCAASNLRWCERWSSQIFKKRFPGVEQANGASFAAPADASPVSETLSVFSSIGNVSNNSQDNLPAEAWININGRIGSFFSSLSGNIESLQVPPINHFMSEILYSRRASRDVLDTLAEVNGNYKSNSEK